MFGYYCGKAELWVNSESPTDEEIAVLAAIYNTSVSGITCGADPGQTARIANCLAGYAEHHAKPQSDTWHLCRRITLHNAVDHLVPRSKNAYRITRLSVNTDEVAHVRLVSVT